MGAGRSMSEKKIDAFLQRLEEQADGRYEIVVKMRALVMMTYPDLEETFSSSLMGALE